MRKPLIIANWKMHKTVTESIRLVTALRSLLSGKQEVEVILAPTAVSLHPISIALQDGPFGVAAQNIHWQESGAFTGEISAAMVAEAGCSHVIVGHSERRSFFAETNEQCQKKVKAAYEHDLVPIVCIGESADEREQSKTLHVLERQLNEIFSGLDFTEGSDFVVAYEPVWAIGTGNNATPSQAEEAHGFIRRHISMLFGDRVADDVRILYGGSVNPENVKGFMQLQDVDGLLVGGASLEPESFAAIVAYNERDN